MAPLARAALPSMSNAIQVIFPYRDNGVWMFDDPSKGLLREPFVCGIPAMLDLLVDGVEEAEKGFALYFSPAPFPGFRLKADLLSSESGGSWYKLIVNGSEMTGWLCPALFQYFETAPAALYVKAEPARLHRPR
jgi:hypothetical protein